jgi:hypothetical protein
MIFRIIIVMLFTFEIANADAFDVCDKHGFDKSNIGWIRTVSLNQQTYVDFKVNIDELNDQGISVPLDIAYALAKDAASNAYFNLYKGLRPPESDNHDLIYSDTQAFSSSCWLKKTYGFRTPLSNFKWVSLSSSDDDEFLPAIKDLLRRKQLIN